MGMTPPTSSLFGMAISSHWSWLDIAGIEAVGKLPFCRLTQLLELTDYWQPRPWQVMAKEGLISFPTFAILVTLSCDIGQTPDAKVGDLVIRTGVKAGWAVVPRGLGVVRLACKAGAWRCIGLTFGMRPPRALFQNKHI